MIAKVFPGLFLAFLFFPFAVSILFSPSAQRGAKGKRPRMLFVPDSARSMGIHIQAGKGSGKSRLMGRIIAWLDFLRGIPQVIFDPHGATIDNFLDKLVRLPREWQARLWQRVIYVDMSGKSGYVYPFPLYYRFGGESLYQISQRFLDVIRKIDPFLQTASIEGWNALWRAGTNCGMLLAALGLQITEAERLLERPMTWKRRFDQILKSDPELGSVISFFQELQRLIDEEKYSVHNRLTRSFSNKIQMFLLEPSMKAMFGSSFPGVDWYRVIDDRMTVLLDFRHEHDIERRRFKMMWAFNYFLDFVKHRGLGRHIPVSLVIDELAALFSVQALAADLFASDLDELINQIARNYSVWLCIAHQEMFQFSEKLQKTLMTMGTHVIGGTSDPDAAFGMARNLFRYEPYWVKKYEPIWMSDILGPFIVDHTSVEFTPEEQFLLRSSEFLRQVRFQFLIRPASGEGKLTWNLYPISISEFDRDQYPIEELTGLAREMLMKYRGWPVNELVAEVDSRHLSDRQKRLLSPENAEITAPFWSS
jgi:hypothetical protein